MTDYASSTIAYNSTTITLLELVKQLLGITDNSQDDSLTMYLQMAGESCESYLDNKLASQSVTEKFSHSMAPVALRFWPVTGDLSVTIDGTDVSSEYQLFTDDGITWSVKDLSGRTLSSNFEQMDIGYTAGYEPLPADIGYAISMTAISYEQGSGGTSGVIKRESVVGVGTIEYSTGDDAADSVGMIPAAQVMVLDKYRRWHV